MSLIQCQTKQLDPIREFFNDDALWAFGGFPALDVAEDKDNIIIKADLPGLSKEAVKLSIEDGVLTIEGERKTEVDQKEKNFYKIERAYGRFVRNVNVGPHVNTQEIRASYDNGVLEIIVPKLERAKSRLIEIK